MDLRGGQAQSVLQCDQWEIGIQIATEILSANNVSKQIQDRRQTHKAIFKANMLQIADPGLLRILAGKVRYQVRIVRIGMLAVSGATFGPFYRT